MCFCHPLGSWASKAAQLPSCLFGILLAKFGLWAESLPQRGLEPLSSHSEDQFQYLNLSGGVLRRVWLITFARGKVTNIWWYPTRVKRPSRIAWAHPFCILERLDTWNRISSLHGTYGFWGRHSSLRGRHHGKLRACALANIGNLWLSSWRSCGPWRLMHGDLQRALGWRPSEASDGGSSTHLFFFLPCEHRWTGKHP